MTSLLRDTLKNAAEESRVLDRPDNVEPASEDSDNELITVESVPGTAAPSRPASRSGMRRMPANSSPLKPLAGGKERRTLDPIRMIPTTVCQRIFGMLDLRSLARCSRVSVKWSKSQTLNYVWFQLYRMENFHDESLPPGKWTKRESKENWRRMYAKDVAKKEPELGPVRPPRSSGYSSPGYASGYVTPREIKEQKWAEENAAFEKPSKVEMRGVYKELGGRKAKSKGKVGATGGARDRGGWAAAEGDDSFY